MKKRLLLLMIAIGVSFAPAVFADGGSAIGAFTRSDTAGQSFCQAGITRTKDVDSGSANANSSDQGSAQASHADIVD